MRSFWISAAAREILPFPLPAPEVPESSGADLLTPCSFAAKEKSAALAAGASQPIAAPVPFFEADAIRLPFADASFDLVTNRLWLPQSLNYEPACAKFSAC